MCKNNEVKAQYVCGICNTAYDTIQKRAQCELDCIKNKEAAEKAAAEAKKKAEKDNRQHEVTAALDNAFALMNKFIEDYGAYHYDGKIKDLNMANLDFFPSKLWHHFWF